MPQFQKETQIAMVHFSADNPSDSSYLVTPAVGTFGYL